MSSLKGVVNCQVFTIITIDDKNLLSVNLVLNLVIVASVLVNVQLL